MEHFLLSLSGVYLYPTLILFALLEGPVIGFFMGVLVSVGVFPFGVGLLILIIGDIIPDTAYYCIGRFSTKVPLFARYKKRLERKGSPLLEKIWHNHSGITVVVSKLAYGISIPLIVSAGFFKVPPKKFFLYAFSTTVIKSIVFLLVGYYAGSLYKTIGVYVQYGQIIFALALLGAIFLYYLFSIYIRKKIVLYTKEEK